MSIKSQVQLESVKGILNGVYIANNCRFILRVGLKEFSIFPHSAPWFLIQLENKLVQA
jgi:hypothetical protein